MQSTLRVRDLKLLKERMQFINDKIAEIKRNPVNDGKTFPYLESEIEVLNRVFSLHNMVVALDKDVAINVHVGNCNVCKRYHEQNHGNKEIHPAGIEVEEATGQ